MILGLTGASGFIGSAVTDCLQERGIRYETSRVELGCDNKLPSLEFEKTCDVVIHLAGKSGRLGAIEAPAMFYRDNTLGTLAALEYCRQHDASLVFPSTYVYGARVGGSLPTLIDERAQASANNPYTQSKLICEEIIRSYARDYGVNAWILRLFNVFGPGQKPNFIIPEIIEKLRKGECLLRSGAVERDFVYVSDVANAVVSAAVSKPTGCELINVGSGTLNSLNQVAELLVSMVNVKVPIVDLGSASSFDYSVYAADVSKASEKLGWSPRMQLPEGLERTLEATDGIQ